MILITRFFFSRILPTRLYSFTIASTIGFVLFLCIPILGYSDFLEYSVLRFSIDIWLAYLSFLIGASIARIIFGRSVSLSILPKPSPIFTRNAVRLCYFWVITAWIVFILTDGPANSIDVIFGGYSHLDYIEEISAQVDNPSGLGILDAVKILADNIFISLWVVYFLKAPKKATVIWFLYIITTMDEYFSRSGIIGKALIPYIAYLVFYPPPKKHIAVQLATAFSIIMIFMSWNSAVRIGKSYTFSPEIVISDVIRDAGSSGVSASIILSEKIRGDPERYLLNLATFVIPRTIWKDKPAEQYNYMITSILTGSRVGEGTSVITSTMLGEAWYYFGWIGTVILMFTFGFFTYLLEYHLSRNILFVGLYLSMFFISIVYIRSTFFDYFQQGIIAIFTTLIFLFLRLSKLNKKLLQRQGK